MGLVCFRLRGASDELNERLGAAINADGRLHLVPARSHGTFFLRLALCSGKTTEADVRAAYEVCVELGERTIATAVATPRASMTPLYAGDAEDSVVAANSTNN